MDPDPGIRIVGLLVGRVQGGSGLVAYFPTFPPTLSGAQLERRPVLPTLEPLDGYVVPPATSNERAPAGRTQLFIGVESSIPNGDARIQSFRIRYRVGDVRYELSVPFTVGICTPFSRWDEDPTSCHFALPGGK